MKRFRELTFFDVTEGKSFAVLKYPELATGKTKL
jgi:hypothetical protein